MDVVEKHHHEPIELHCCLNLDCSGEAVRGRMSSDPSHVAGRSIFICHCWTQCFFFPYLSLSLFLLLLPPVCRLKLITKVQWSSDSDIRHVDEDAALICLDRYFSISNFVYLAVSLFPHPRPQLGFTPSPFPTSLLLGRRLMHWAGRSWMPTLPIASITHDTAGQLFATSCQESRLEPLHLTLLVRQLYFTSALHPRVKRCQSSCARPP